MRRKIVSIVCATFLLIAGTFGVVKAQQKEAPNPNSLCSTSYTATLYWVDHYTGLVSYIYNVPYGCQVWTTWGPWATTFLYVGECVIPSLRRAC